MRRIRLATFGPLAALLGGNCLGGDGPERVVAAQIADRSQLVGGPGALGDVGDFLLENDQIRLIIQGAGYSRGFGVFGGSLIDADLRRPRRRSDGDSRGGLGRDNFSEMFPALFLAAMAPDNVRAVDNPDGSASIIVSGGAGDFLKLAGTVNELLAPSDDLRFTTEYRLQPGVRWVEIRTTVRNVGGEAVRLPDPGIVDFLGEGITLELPVGDVLLFGAGNDVFAEQAGFDLRFTLEEKLKDPPGLPQLPGLVVPFLASRGDGVSYGFASGIQDPRISLTARAGYPDTEPDDLVVPFLASAFTGAFYGAAPRALASRADAFDVCDADCPGACVGGYCQVACEPNGAACAADAQCVAGVCDRSAFTFTKFFIVGDGDVASVRDAFHELRGDEVVQLGGRVLDAGTGAPEAGADVVVLDADGRPFNQHTTDGQGGFVGLYPPGRYAVRVLAEGRLPSEPFAVELGGPGGFVELQIPSPGFVTASIRTEAGEPMPGKCQLVAVHEASTATTVPGRAFLYDLSLGERVRPRDLVPDRSEDPSTRRYIEQTLLVGLEPITARVRPGRYTAVCSRGLEFELQERTIVVEAGKAASVDVRLRKAVDTCGLASGDFHLHAINSVDSFLGLEERVLQVAAEGVDLASSSDHNFVTDYTRAIASQGLNPWVQGMVGLEATTLEVGHFNGFPLAYDPGPITKGAFEWSGRTPASLFEDLRALGKYGPERTVIQVNHPRDTIQGYFNTYGYNPDTGRPEEGGSVLFSPMGPEFGIENFELAFDALEIVNGKRRDLSFTYRVPESLPPPPLPDDIPPAGEILRDDEGRVAFPGARDDWFTHLSLGRLYTATGNSDTHGLDEEPGVPRNFFPVSDDRPGAIDELEVVDALQNQRVVVSSGPIVSVEMEGAGDCRALERRNPPAECVGTGTTCSVRLARQRCRLGEMATGRSDGSLSLFVEVQAASWIQLDALTVWQDGAPVAELEGEVRGAHRFELAASADGWVVVEVGGSQSMFPVVTPLEIEPIQVADAVAAIGSGFGFDLNPFGNLRPKVVTPALPYAITNPIFVDGDGDARWAPPGLAGRYDGDPRRPPPHRAREDVPVLLRMFSLFGSHAH